MKWLLTVAIVLVVFSLVAQRWRLRLPGDFSVPVRGRMYYIPVASTLVLSLAVWAIGKLL
ncbi:MAG TPA: DUF2905 domain-containing protein [Burkholderiales bacterium]|nr:DUF2905 domain-containing protein [Burkholderiales bacterium]